MFTGIIEDIGTIKRLYNRGSSIVLSITPSREDFRVEIGGSVSVDGVCLTLEKWENKEMLFTAVEETLNRTTLKKATSEKKVNLERAILATSRLDGHIVYGHVDGIGKIVYDRDVGGSLRRTIEAPEQLMIFMAEKGSVAIDGISLTIAKTEGNTITVSLVPHTLNVTTMFLKKIGDYVNIECDMVARYLYRFLEKEERHNKKESIISLLERCGF